VSSTNPAFDLTVRNTASTPYSLKVMTVVALVLLPIVLAYQAWTYYVFRRRISDQSFRAGMPTTPRPAVAATIAMAGQGATATGGAGQPGGQPGGPAGSTARSRAEQSARAQHPAGRRRWLLPRPRHGGKRPDQR
jgi:Cytochrome bd terminal oxidase subunit II